MKKFNFFAVITFLLAGVLGGALSYFLESKILALTIATPIDFQFESLLYLGFSVGATVAVVTMLQEYKITRLIQRKTHVLFPLGMGGIFSGLYFFSENTIITWIFLTLSFSICIYLGVTIFQIIFKSKISKSIAEILGATIGGASGGIFISLVYVLRINFSIDEGFFLLSVLLISIIGSSIGFVIFFANKILSVYFKNKINYLNKNIHEKKTILFSFVVIIMLFIVTLGSYWNSIGVGQVFGTEPENYEDFFVCQYDEKRNELEFQFNKNELKEYLENKSEKTIDVLYTLFLLTGEDKYAQEFKKLLTDEAKNKKFVGISDSHKAWQFDAMNRAYFFIKLKETYPDLFTKHETNNILEWFKEINDSVYRVSFSDIFYGFSFKKIPDGPYENQEIGVGLLSVLAEVLKEKYPEISNKNMDYVEKFGIGWKENFRNPDDGIVYHQQMWVKNAYVMSQFGLSSEHIQNNNRKNSFEWILLQWPPNGQSPAYNVPSDNTPFDIMILGAYLVNDGRYLWIAEKMIQDEIKNPQRDTGDILGLEYMNEQLMPVRPSVGSCFIQGTTGIAQNPGPLKPDKMVFREGWDDDSMYALLNLRFSGWHSYKATNSFVTIMYGEPFVVENLENKEYPWLPKGIAKHRDEKIGREDLNGFLIKKRGMDKLIQNMIGVDSKWYQDTPKFANVLFFNSTANVDFSKTSIYDWHGWQHNRISVLVKDHYFLVFDNADGSNKDQTAISWNLKGDPEFFSDHIKLNQGDYSLSIHYPHLDDEYKVEIINHTRSVNHEIEIHDPDITLQFISENKSRFNSVTLFYPEKDSIKYKVEKMDVLNDRNELSSLNANGIKIIKQNQIDIIGARFDSNFYTYEDIKTNADIFVSQRFLNEWVISFQNANRFEIDFEGKILSIESNEKTLVKDKDYFHSNKTLVINTNLNENYIKIDSEN